MNPKLVELINRYASDYPDKDVLETEDGVLSVLGQTLEALTLALNDWHNYNEIVLNKYNTPFDEYMKMWTEAINKTNEDNKR